MNYRGILSASALALLVAWASAGASYAQSISQALTAAYDHAPDLQSALLSAKASAEGIVQAKSGLLPNIGATISGSQGTSLVGGNWNASSSLSTGLSYSQTIFDNNRTAAQVEAARAAAEVAEYQIRYTEQNVLLQVVQAYMAVLSGRELLALRQENVTFFQAQLQSAQDRLDVGEGTRIDVAQAQARLAQGQAAQQAALGDLQNSEASFQRLVGQRPQGLSTGHAYANLLPRSIDAAIAEAEIGHPAILLSKASIRAAQAGSDAAQAGYFGATAGVTGQVGTSWTGPSGNPARDGISASLGFQINIPIYSGGRMGSAVRQANLNQIKSEVDAMSAYDQIREAVISAWTGIQSADAQISAAQAAVSSSNTVLDGVIQERDLGAATTLDVLNAQADLTSAREALINASNGKIIATFSLLSAMGRLTAHDLGLAVEIKTAVPYTQAVEDVWQELRTVVE
ncbi:TolC family outer membrane protein [Devosia sp. XJ19-1]|uniref:TolC family outer membrane protein n=1 Tax=Devosia ureilytica TaxID=2952754 RepID=A0A9Q4FR92_9HYPH|nr:TolC family outer membrane protein [Devosia ureilytica]MCP8882116.1 TolC family outer membrane protein [Devosia ureilytica]MCP8885998.1 TolC family outer membrane protein [Devosia ureilytica]